MGPVGKDPAVDLLDPHPQLAVVKPGANGVGTAYFLAVDGRPEGQELALDKAEVVREIRWNLEVYNKGLIGVRPDAADR
jgi:hypothetical protein